MCSSQGESLASSGLAICKYSTVIPLQESANNVFCDYLEDLVLRGICPQNPGKTKSKPVWILEHVRVTFCTCSGLSIRQDIKSLILMLEESSFDILTWLQTSKYLDICHKQPLALYRWCSYWWLTPISCTSRELNCWLSWKVKPSRDFSNRGWRTHWQWLLKVGTTSCQQQATQWNLNCFVDRKQSRQSITRKQQQNEPISSHAWSVTRLLTCAMQSPEKPIWRESCCLGVLNEFLVTVELETGLASKETTYFYKKTSQNDTIQTQYAV